MRRRHIIAGLISLLLIHEMPKQKLDYTLNNIEQLNNQDPRIVTVEYVNTTAQIKQHTAVKTKQKTVIMSRNRLEKMIQSAKSDIYQLTNDVRILRLKYEDVAAAIFTILLHESNFLRQKKSKTGDICYMQINKYYWPYRRRRELLNVAYTNDQLLANIGACIDTGLRIMLYNYSICKTDKKTDFEKLVVCYHAPHNTANQKQYSNAIRKKVRTSAIRNDVRQSNVHYIQTAKYQKPYHDTTHRSNRL